MIRWLDGDTLKVVDRVPYQPSFAAPEAKSDQIIVDLDGCLEVHTSNSGNTKGHWSKKENW